MLTKQNRINIKAKARIKPREKEKNEKLEDKWKNFFCSIHTTARVLYQ